MNFFNLAFTTMSALLTTISMFMPVGRVTPPQLVDVSMGITYTKFQNLAEYESELNALANSPLVNVKVAENSYTDNLPIYLIEIGNRNKPTIFMDAALHALNEWQTVHILLKFAHDLVTTGTPQDDFDEYILDNYCVVLVPIANPWGYFEAANGMHHNGHVSTVTDIQNLTWHDYTNYAEYKGVNLNRNFDAGWEEFQNLPWSVQSYWNGTDYGTANYFMMPNPPVLAPDYGSYDSKGITPFSEPETQVIRNVFNEYDVIMYFDWHCMNDWQSNASAHIPEANTVDITNLVNAATTRVNNRNQSQDKLQQAVVITPEGYNAPTALRWATTKTKAFGFGYETGRLNLPDELWTDMYLELMYRGIEYISY
jgi:hypothetical protein